MKLRYIKNLFYYDGPLIDLYIDEDGYDTYITYPLWMKEEKGFRFLVKKVDDKVERNAYEKDTYFYPVGWFSTKDPTNELFVLDANECVETKEWNEKFPYWIVEARPITEDERQLWAEDTNDS